MTTLAWPASGWAGSNPISAVHLPKLPLNGAPVWVPENPKWLLSACTVQSAAMAGVARKQCGQKRETKHRRILQEILRHTGSIRFMMPFAQDEMMAERRPGMDPTSAISSQQPNPWISFSMCSTGALSPKRRQGPADAARE